MQNEDDLNTMLSLMLLDNTGYDAEVLAKVLNMIEKNYNLPQGVLEKKFELFKGNWGRYTDNLKNNSEIPTDIDYSPTIKDLISRPQNSGDTAKTYRYYTNESLQNIVSKILNVKNTETFMDCCCGMFSSALYNDAANYIGLEQDKEILGLAAMNLIMCKKKFDIMHENFIESKHENVADKIFADLSYGVDMSRMNERPYGKNGEAYCIEKVVNALKDGGTAVVVCVGSVLTKQDSSKKLRESITKDHLKAVVALPSMNCETKVNSNLIVLQKNCHAKEIKFVNASSFEIENDKRMTLKESDVFDLLKCMDGKKSSCRFKNVKTEDILNSNTISWVPNYYVESGETSVGRSVEEIDKDLKSAYKELKKILQG